MSTTRDCPESECWQALVAATLPPDEQERWAQHLEACTACQERLDQAEECRDGLVKLARQLGDPTVAPADSSLVQILEHLHKGRYPGPTDPAEAADLYFLRPADRPGVLGTLGAYEVTEVIGQGGMGVVLKAFEPALHRQVAIKVLAPAVAGSATARRRFTREAKAAAAVCHEHVVTVHGVSEADGLPYLVMQYVAGESLQARLDRTGPLDTMEIVRIGLQTAAGLAAAHAQGLIHRDIKPANLLLQMADGRLQIEKPGEPTAVDQSAICHLQSAIVKITDFGLARTADDVGLTQDGVVAGTPEYMAPEQARGEPIDHRADLFSLGSVLYALATGVPPFRGATALAVLRQVNEEAPPTPRSVNPDVPAWLEAVIMRLLAKDPAGRFQSAAEVAGLLEGYLAHLRQPTSVPAPKLAAPPGARRTGPSARGPWAGPGRWRRLGAGLVALVLLASLGFGIPWWLAAGTPDPATEYPQQYDHRFQGPPDKSAGLELFGPNAEDYVRFEPEDALIAVSGFHAGEQTGTGLRTTFGVKGDFEITVDFEILREPEPAVAGKRQTRFTLAILLDREGFNEAALSRRVQSEWGTQFITSVSLWDGAAGKDQKKGNGFKTKAKAGRLRLVRRGSVLAYYAAEGSGGDFTRLTEYPFGPEDLKDVRVVGCTGNPESFLDVRVTDLRIRAASLPPSGDGGRPPREVEDKGRPVVVALLGLALILSVIALGAWYFVRRSRRAAGAPAPAAGLASFACPGCGKNLKARADLAGKKVRCRHCGAAVLLPEG